MKAGDLIKFNSKGHLGTIVDTSTDFGGYAVVWISGEVTFPNPTHMNMKSLIEHAEVVSENR